MKKIKMILNNKDYLGYLFAIGKCEKNRKFCLHNIEHFLDVARIAQLINLDELLGVDKEKVYAAALLHDIGRWLEYRDGIPHEEASASLAAPILQEVGFLEEDRREISQAILLHRNPGVEKMHDLCDILYRADKLSRNCWICESRNLCNKKIKNDTIIY